MRAALFLLVACLVFVSFAQDVQVYYPREAAAPQGDGQPYGAVGEYNYEYYRLYGNNAADDDEDLNPDDDDDGGDDDEMAGGQDDDYFFDDDDLERVDDDDEHDYADDDFGAIDNQYGFVRNSGNSLAVPTVLSVAAAALVVANLF